MPSPDQAVVEAKDWLQGWAALDPVLQRFLDAPSSAWALLPETPENLLNTLQPQSLHAFDWQGETGLQDWQPGNVERVQFFHFFFAEPLCWFYADDEAFVEAQDCRSCVICTPSETWLVHIE